MEGQYTEGDFYDYDFSQVEASQNFVPAKSGTYLLKIDEINVGPRGEIETNAPDDDTRLIANIRHSFVDPSGVETVGQGTLGMIFNRLWLHTPKALGFLRGLVEAHGGDWTAFYEGIKAGKGRPIADVFQELLSQFVGTTAEAKVALVTKNSKTGEELANPRNEIARYIVQKTVNN